MKTIIHHISNDNLDHIVKEAATILQKGGLVVFPTETVYGIGANALNPSASDKIYQVKGRPSDNPLIVHVADHIDIRHYVTEVSEQVEMLIDQFWPGPLTIVLPKRDVIPYSITGGLHTVAIRCPGNDIAQALLQASHLPICAPSANMSGTPSATTFQHVYDDLFGKVDMIIDGGHSAVGLESTVLDMTETTPVILRPGYITKRMIEETLKVDVIDQSESIAGETPKSPGMKYRHYAPKANVILLYGTHEQIQSHLKNVDPHTTGLLASKELIDLVHLDKHYSLGSISEPDTIAKHIFFGLRYMDTINTETLYVEAFSDNDLFKAIMNRLRKAANNQIIHL